MAMTKMQALIKKERAPGLWLEELPLPTIDEFDVLIRILRSSICGTDLHIYEWDPWAQRTIPTPMQIGHEFAGVIETVGSHVIDFHPGMIVTGEGHIVCGRCRRNCLAGRRHLCRKTNGVGVNRPGAFAEYLSIPQTNVWLADPKIPLEVLSCFDPLGNAVHTALSFDVLGEDVLITGAGPIGIMAAAIARHAGARFVVITDVNPYRLDLAAKMGVTMAVDVGKVSLQQVMDDLGMKEGFDVGLEMSGHSDALNGMLAAMCHGGKVAVLGIQSKNATVDWDLVIFNGLTIKGIYGREMYETWYKMTTMIQSGLDITPVITHQFPYPQFEKGFQLMKTGQSGKIILHWSDL
jgi:threonine 3-dehydrogenase